MYIKLPEYIANGGLCEIKRSVAIFGHLSERQKIILFIYLFFFLKNPIYSKNKLTYINDIWMRVECQWSCYIISMAAGTSGVARWVIHQLKRLRLSESPLWLTSFFFFLIQTAIVSCSYKIREPQIAVGVRWSFPTSFRSLNDMTQRGRCPTFFKTFPQILFCCCCCLLFRKLVSIDSCWIHFFLSHFSLLCPLRRIQFLFYAPKFNF